jgi:malic enzyme
VAFGGRLHRIGQGNNAFIFPGVGLGLWVGRVRRVTYGMFIDAARALASQVTLADAADGAVYPELTRIRACSHAVACAVVRRAIVEEQSALPRGAVVEELVSDAMWFPEYREIRYEPHVELAAVR